MARYPLLAMLVLSVAFSSAAEVISVDPDFPVQGKEARVRVTNEVGMPLAGARVRVTYRPESRVAVEADIGRTDSFGMVRWVPEDAGIVTLTAESPSGRTTRAFSVRFSAVPKLGVLVLALAGIILIGGSARRFKTLLRAERP